MFGLCCKRLQLLRVVPIYQFQKTSHFARLYSSKSLLGGQDEKYFPFTVSYLINSFGLSPESALSLFKKKRVHFESPERPDSVVKLLKNYEFSDTHISKIVEKLPELLLIHPERTLLPKLEYFGSIGISGTALAETISGNPIVLKQSLDNCIRPCCDIIKTLGIPDGNVAYFIQKSRWMLKVKRLGNVARNLSVLRSHQVPESMFSLCRQDILFALSADADEFEENVNKVINKGVHFSSHSFMKALYVMAVMDESKWQQRKELYSRYEWTEDHILLAFRKEPTFMSISEKKFSTIMDFLVNKMGLRPADVAGYPGVLAHSLEKWIMPRCSIIRVLLLKGLIRKGDFSLLGTGLMTGKSQFLARFVIPYKELIPELLSIFEGKIDLADLGFKFESWAYKLR